MPLRPGSIFFPAILIFAAAAAAAEVSRDIEFAAPAPGVKLTLDAYVPDGPGPFPAVILVHGGGWEAGSKTTYINPWFPVLSQAGFAWFSIDYRLAPAHAYPAAIEDVETAIAWVRRHARQYRVDPRRIALMGESAGGHLAALAGARRKQKVAGVVSFYGVHNFVSWMQPEGAVRKNAAQFLGVADFSDTSVRRMREASATTYVSRGVPPYLFIHGTGDKGVPYAQSNEMCDLIRRAAGTCEVFLLDGAPHGVENWEKNPALHIWKPKLVDWLRATLK